MRSALLSIGSWNLLIWSIVLLLASVVEGYGGSRVVMEERFVTLKRWQPVEFESIEIRSTYQLVEEDGVPCLLMQSDGGASAIRMKGTFDVYEYPRLSWRWKVSNVYNGGDGRNKKGDDYPARIYILFYYEPKQASLIKRIKFEAMKKIYGEYPPDSSLNYIWANKPHSATVIASAYTDQVMMIPVESGRNNTGIWQEYTVDIVSDYILAFERNPPKKAALAVMIDSDNTGESARTWIDYIRISK